MFRLYGLNVKYPYRFNCLNSFVSIGGSVLRGWEVAGRHRAERTGIMGYSPPFCLSILPDGSSCNQSPQSLTASAPNHSIPIVTPSQQDGLWAPINLSFLNLFLSQTLSQYEKSLTHQFCLVTEVPEVNLSGPSQNEKPSPLRHNHRKGCISSRRNDKRMDKGAALEMSKRILLTVMRCSLCFGKRRKQVDQEKFQGGTC